SRFPQQPGRFGGGEHAADRKGRQRTTAPHWPCGSTRRAAAHPRGRPARSAQGMTAEPAHRRPAEQLPEWYPGWAAQLADLYFSGTTAAFILHGNTNDVFRIANDGDGPRYGILAEFLAEQLFGRWLLVLHYDLGRGLRAFGG